MSAAPLRYGLVGYPVAHSFSAAMHNAAFAHLAIDARYELFAVEPPKLASFLRSLSDQGIAGVNITIPHKIPAVALLQQLSPEVEEIGATNTIYVGADGALRGYNTDCLGFGRHIDELGITPRRVALIGAGGAANAVAVALAQRAVELLLVYDIDRKKAAAIAEKINERYRRELARAVASPAELGVADKDLLVNASPVGAAATDPCLMSDDAWHPGLFVYDLIYNPAQTKLLERAAARGLRCCNGLTMLLYQGIKAFELWTGRPAPETVMRQALQEEMNRCRTC